MSKKKKVIILSVMVLLLLVTGIVNVSLNNNLTASPASTVSTTSESFYSLYRQERESTRTQEIQFYESIIASNTATTEAKAEAETCKLELIDQMEKELIVEGIIRGKGFNDAVITISNSNVNVFVKSSELKSSEVAQITDVVMEQLAVEIDDIVIIPSE